MRRAFLLLVAVLLSIAAYGQQNPQAPRVLALYSTNVESDHVEFARQAIRFYSELARTKNVQFEAATDWKKLTTDEMRFYRAVLWLNDSPHTPAQRQGFQNYMEAGGGWIGFHVAAYNDNNTHWPWFVDFLGGAVFYSNNWPPLPAALTVDAKSDVTQGLPAHFVASANEWYIWKPSPRLNARVKVILTLDPANYPLGFKDVLLAGDLPVVWTNTNYNMLYLNMGHGDKIFTDPNQNLLLQNAFLSILHKRKNTH
jgi:type 1 glutamine amidotransferase